MASPSPATAALLDRLVAYDSVVEVGIGTRVAVAGALAAQGTDVTATDIHSREVPRGVRFVRDDVFNPDLAVYRGTETIYALNCPPELHRPIREIARAVDALFQFTTLGTDPPAIPAAPETLPDDTLYQATEQDLPGSARSSIRRSQRTAAGGSGDDDSDGDGSGDDGGRR